MPRCRSWQTQSDGQQAPERSRASYGTVQNGDPDGDAEVEEMRFDASSNGCASAIWGLCFRGSSNRT